MAIISCFFRGEVVSLEHMYCICGKDLLLKPGGHPSGSYQYWFIRTLIISIYLSMHVQCIYAHKYSSTVRSYFYKIILYHITSDQ